MTGKQIQEMTGHSKERLCQLRKTVLTKDKDWKWIDGKIVYIESALKKIQSKKIYKERK